MRQHKVSVMGVLAVMMGLLLVPALGAAQQAGGPGNRMRRERPDLGLSPQQQQEMHRIHRQARERIQAIRQNTSLTPQQQRARIRQVRAKARHKAQSILTPEQQQKLREFRQERRGSRGGPGANGPQGGPPASQGPQGR